MQLLHIIDVGDVVPALVVLRDGTVWHEQAEFGFTADDIERFKEERDARRFKHVQGLPKRSLAAEIWTILKDHGLTPLHLADDAESHARYESILRGDVELVPYITLLRAGAAVKKAIAGRAGLSVEKMQGLLEADLFRITADEPDAAFVSLVGRAYGWAADDQDSTGNAIRPS